MLKKWLSRRRSNPAADTLSDDRYAALQELARRHSFVEVSFHRTGRSYQSMVLALRAELGEIVLDELFPGDGTDTLRRGDLADVVQRGERHSVSFVTRLLGREQLQGNPAYRMELPASVGGHDNRDAYRVYVDNEAGLALELAFEDEEPMLCRIVNLSIEGLKIDIDGDFSEALQRQRRFQGCRLQLPDSTDIDCEIVVRNVACLQKPVHTLAGAELKIPSAPHRVRLNRYLAAVQRRQRRREVRI